MTDSIMHIHWHHGLKYLLNPVTGRCEWYSCYHNTYNGDYPESCEHLWESGDIRSDFICANCGKREDMK